MYVLITYYNRGTSSQPQWDVYGHIGPGRNDRLGVFDTEQEAQSAAFNHDLPVMRGSHAANIDNTLRKLIG